MSDDSRARRTASETIDTGPTLHLGAEWKHLCAAASLPGSRLLDLPFQLEKIILKMPQRFARYAQQLVTGIIDDRPPGQQRPRDLLPLPLCAIDAADLPRLYSHTEGLASRKASRSAWLLVLVTALNYHYCLGSCSKSIRPLSGPATPVQHAALVRLGAAADGMCCMSPDKLEAIDFRKK